MKIHYRKYCKILTQVIKEAKHMHYNKQVLESNKKVKAVWKIVKKETGKYSTEEVTPSIKINDNAIQNPKLFANSFNTDFLTIIERMNNDTTTLTTEDATKYLTEAIPKTFPNIYLMPTTVNEIKSIIGSLK
jgi:superoxide dismutase